MDVSPHQPTLKRWIEVEPSVVFPTDVGAKAVGQGAGKVSAPNLDVARPPVSKGSDMSQWEGRAFGGIVLAAFLLYGIGSATTDQPIGLALVVVNSIAVSLAGLIGFRLVRATDANVGSGYLVARVAEAVLLAGGIVMSELAEVSDAGTAGYLLGMIALSVGSIPFFETLGRRRWIPRPLATWGICGYAALAIGAVIELATGRSVAVIFALPGGLFEFVLGLRLIWRGFDHRMVNGPVQ